MNYLGIGDLATSVQARRQNSSLKTELNRLTTELSSGRTSDVSMAVKGQLAPLASIERSLKLNSAFSDVASNAALKLNIVENTLRNIGSGLDGLAASMLGAANAGAVQNEAIISSAAGLFEATISNLSVQVAGDYVFSGVAAHQAPLVPAQEILDELAIVTNGAGTAIDFYDRVSNWFNSPGGFEAFAYLGGNSPSSKVKISSTDSFSFEVTAKFEEIREILTGLASISLLEGDIFSGSNDEKLELSKITAEGLLPASDRLISLQAGIGEEQERISLAQIQNQSESFYLATSQNELLQVDLFETASRLESVQTQLEGFYLIMAKTARLNLAEYLR